MNNLLRKIDLTSLRLFVTVCQEGNIARAAARELIAPSAVSRRIAEIEGVVGLPIIQRESRGISVTPVGEAVLRCAHTVIANIEALGAELSQFYSGAKGHVKIVANLGSIVQFLPEDIAAFKRIFPEIDISVEELHSSDVIRAVDEMEADFGICNAIEGIERFEHRPYRTDFLGVVFPKNHALAGVAEVEFKDLINESFIGFRGEGASLTQQIVKAASHLNAKLNIKIWMSSLDAMSRMVHVGLGIAIVPWRIGELYVDKLDVGMVRLADEWAERRSVVIFRPEGQLNATAKTLIRALTEPD